MLQYAMRFVLTALFAFVAALVPGAGSAEPLLHDPLPASYDDLPIGPSTNVAYWADDVLHVGSRSIETRIPADHPARRDHRRGSAERAVRQSLVPRYRQSPEGAADVRPHRGAADLRQRTVDHVARRATHGDHRRQARRPLSRRDLRRRRALDRRHLPKSPDDRVRRRDQRHLAAQHRQPRSGLLQPGSSRTAPAETGPPSDPGGWRHRRGNLRRGMAAWPDDPRVHPARAE